MTNNETAYTVPEGSSHIKDVHPPQFRPIANPAVLGLCACATTTFTLSCFNAHIVPKTAEGAVLGLAFLSPVFGSTLSTTPLVPRPFGAFWMSFAWYVSYVVAGIPAADRHHGTGIFLCAWTIFSFVMLIGSYRTNVGLFSLFCVLEITFILLTIGSFRQSEGTIKAGDWFGLLLAFMAWYMALSNLFKATWKEDVLPLKSMEKKK